MRLALALVLAGAPLLATAHAGGATAVDWAKGVVTAEGVGVADRHAPNPAVARGTSRRGAEDAARKVLAAKLGELPVATGGTVADKAKDAAVKARLERAVANAVAIAAEPETDGAWRVTMAVPIDAIRQALDAPRALPASGDAGPPVVIVDGVTAKPAIGYTIAGKHVATVFADAAGFKDAPHVKAGKVTRGDIAIAGDVSGTDATLYVLVK